MKYPDEKAHSLRIAEIIAQLAEQKRAYIVDGIDQPLSVRVTLEAELAQLRLEKLQIHGAGKARDMQVRQLRGELLKRRLHELGFPDLQSQCNAQAEAQIPQLTP